MPYKSTVWTKERLQALIDAHKAKLSVWAMVTRLNANEFAGLKPVSRKQVWNRLRYLGLKVAAREVGHPLHSNKWPKSRDEKLTELRKLGWSYGLIVPELNADESLEPVTRNGAIGRAGRIGLRKAHKTKVQIPNPPPKSKERNNYNPFKRAARTPASKPPQEMRTPPEELQSLRLPFIKVWGTNKCHWATNDPPKDRMFELGECCGHSGERRGNAGPYCKVHWNEYRPKGHAWLGGHPLSLTRSTRRLLGMRVWA